MGVSGPHCISQVPKVSFLQLVQSNLCKLWLCEEIFISKQHSGGGERPIPVLYSGRGSG